MPIAPENMLHHYSIAHHDGAFPFDVTNGQGTLEEAALHYLNACREGRGWADEEPLVCQVISPIREVRCARRALAAEIFYLATQDLQNIQPVPRWVETRCDPYGRVVPELIRVSEADDRARRAEWAA